MSSVVMLDDSVIRDNYTLVAEAKGLSLFLFQQAFACGSTEIEEALSTPGEEVEISITLSKKNLIQIGTLLHQLSSQLAKVSPS